MSDQEISVSEAVKTIEAEEYVRLLSDSVRKTAELQVRCIQLEGRVQHYAEALSQLQADANKDKAEDAPDENGAPDA